MKWCNYWANKITESSFLPFLRWAKLFILSPSPLSSFSSSRPKFLLWRKGLLWIQFMDISCERKFGSEGFCFVLLCLSFWKFTDWYSCFTLHLQMSSCYIWWPPSINRCTFTWCSIVSVKNSTTLEYALSKKSKRKYSKKLFHVLIHMHLRPVCVFV